MKVALPLGTINISFVKQGNGNGRAKPSGTIELASNYPSNYGGIPEIRSVFSLQGRNIHAVMLNHFVLDRPRMIN